MVGWLVSKSRRKAEAEGCVCHRFLRIGLGSVAGTACSAVAFSGDLDLAGGGGLRVLRFFGVKVKGMRWDGCEKKWCFKQWDVFFLFWILTYDPDQKMWKVYVTFYCPRTSSILCVARHFSLPSGFVTSATCQWHDVDNYLLVLGREWGNEPLDRYINTVNIYIYICKHSSFGI